MTLTTETLGDLIDLRYSVYVTCYNQKCTAKSKQLDLVAVAAKVGLDHGALAVDFQRLLVCGACGSKEFGVTIIPDYQPRG